MRAFLGEGKKCERYQTFDYGDRQRYQTYDIGIHARVWTRRAWRSVASSSMFVSILFGFSF
jgi:hypothetical protein